MAKNQLEGDFDCEPELELGPLSCLCLYVIFILFLLFAFLAPRLGNCDSAVTFKSLQHVPAGFR